jgi:hypothetical protein
MAAAAPRSSLRDPTSTVRPFAASLCDVTANTWIGPRDQGDACAWLSVLFYVARAAASTTSVERLKSLERSPCDASAWIARVHLPKMLRRLIANAGPHGEDAEKEVRSRLRRFDALQNIRRMLVDHVESRRRRGRGRGRDGVASSPSRHLPHIGPAPRQRVGRRPPHNLKLRALEDDGGLLVEDGDHVIDRFA